MKLLSTLSGEVVRPDIVLSALNTHSNHCRYSLENSNGLYSVLHLLGDNCSAWFVDVTAKHRADTLTAFNEQPTDYLLISLRNTFGIKLTGIPPLLLYDLSFVLLSAPALIVETRLQPDSNYSLFILLFPHTGSNLMSATPLPLTKQMIQVIEQLNSQVNSNVNEQCRQLITMASSVRDSDKDHKQPAIKMEDAQRLHRIREYIEQNILNPGFLTIQEVAEGTGINKDNVKTIFRTYLKTTPHRYITERKLQVAITLICNPDNKIENVANTLGIDKATLFRQFKKLYQMSPAEFRRLQNG